MFIGFIKPAWTLKGNPKLFKLFNVLYSSGTMCQILGPRYEALSQYFSVYNDYLFFVENLEIISGDNSFCTLKISVASI